MRLGVTAFVLSLIGVSLFPCQAMSSEPSKAKVCVAVVNNHTLETGVPPSRMTLRLAKAITDKELSAVAMDSSTGNSVELRPTTENSEEMETRACDYLVLTMITGSSGLSSRDTVVAHSGLPSMDASDPQADRSGPVHLYELRIKFAIFRPKAPNPILDTEVEERGRSDASNSLMDAMDREGNRLKHELQKNNKKN